MTSRAFNIMPSSFRIIPRLGLVLIEHSGFITVQESLDSIAAYAVHPDARPGQKHLATFAQVTDYERDWLRIMSIQARLADVVVPSDHETLLVMHAPHKVAREVAILIRKSWEGNGGVIPNIVQTEAEALSLLGIKGTQFHDSLVAG